MDPHRTIDTMGINYGNLSVLRFYCTTEKRILENQQICYNN